MDWPRKVAVLFLRSLLLLFFRKKRSVRTAPLRKVKHDQLMMFSSDRERGFLSVIILIVYLPMTVPGPSMLEGSKWSQKADNISSKGNQANLAIAAK